MAKKRTKVAFIGLGLMGSAMAERLLKAGYPLQVWNRTAEKVEPLVAAGAKRAATPATAARGADIVIVMVADDAAVDAVIFGEDGLSRGMKRRSVLINCSTTSPSISYRASTALRSLNISYLEAPVLRSIQAAREGKLQILVAGARDHFAKAKPVLQALGKDIHYVGATGKASTLKIGANILMAGMLQAFTEFFTVTRKAGIPFESVMEVLNASALNSEVFRNAEQAVVNPAARTTFYLRHFVKDVNLATDLARQMDVPVPATALARQLLVTAKNLGHGDEDYTTMVDLMAAWAGVPVR